MRSLIIEENKKKRDVEKMKKEIKKLKIENTKNMQMVNGMKDRCEEKLKAN